MRILPAISLLAAFTLSLAASEANAKCIREDPALKWSFPADGDTDVPTNAAFWAIANDPLVRLRVEGAGSASPGEHAWSFVPPPLEPDTDYTLVVEMGADAAVVERLAFRTGPGPVDELPEPPVVLGHASGEEQVPAPACSGVVRDDDCFDTGQVPVVLEMEDSPLLWLYNDGEGAWPASCGGPVDYVQHDPPDEPLRTCFELIAVSRTGARSAPAVYCTGAPDEEPLLPVGCAGVRASAPAALVTLGIVLLFRRRRR